MERKLQQYASLFDNNPDAVSSIDLEGNITNINRAGEELSGYTAQELMKMSIWDVLPEEFVKKEKTTLLNSIRNGSPGSYILHTLHKQGHLVEVCVTTCPIIVDGQVIGQYAITKKISSLIQTKQALLRMEEEFRETVRLQQGMTIKFKKIGNKFIHSLCDGDLVYRSGFAPEHVVGKELFDFLPYELAEVKTEFYQRAWNGESVIYEGSTPNGIAYLASLKPIFRDNQVVEVIGSCVDITERKCIEEALRKSEENYRLIAENALDLIRVVDTEGRIKYASPSHQAILGVSPESLLGQPCFSLINPSEQEKARIQFREMVTSKKKLQKEFLYSAPNGSTLLFDVNGMPVLGETGDVEKVVVVARDITERRRTENLLRNSDKLSVIGELAAGIAHEIRNPLTALKGFIQFLHHKEENTQYLDVMLSEVERINAITSELLLLAKPQALDFKKHRLSALLHSVITLLEPQATLTNVQFQVRLEDEMLEIVCEEKQLKQVFINIIKNGIEAMPTGGLIMIEAKIMNQTDVLIRFIDQGQGISDELIPKLGEPFYSTKEKGTGLGLMVSYKIIKEHRGSISFHSVLNRGTTVDILLPLSAF